MKDNEFGFHFDGSYYHPSELEFILEIARKAKEKSIKIKRIDKCFGNSIEIKFEEIRL